MHCIPSVTTDPISSGHLDSTHLHKGIGNIPLLSIAQGHKFNQQENTEQNPTV